MSRPLMLIRRAMRRQPAATTVTVTRVVGGPGDEHEEPIPDVVVVKTEEPEEDTGALRLVRLTLSVSVVTLALLVLYLAFRVVRYEIRLRVSRWPEDSRRPR